MNEICTRKIKKLDKSQQYRAYYLPLKTMAVTVDSHRSMAALSETHFADIGFRFWENWHRNI